MRWYDFCQIALLASIGALFIQVLFALTLSIRDERSMPMLAGNLPYVLLFNFAFGVLAAIVVKRYLK